MTKIIKNLSDVSCLLTSVGNISVPNGGFGFLLPFDSEHFDTDNMHDNAVNNTNIVVPTSGKYIFGASVNWTLNATGIRIIGINSTTQGFLPGGDTRNAMTSGVVGASHNTSGIFQLSAGEILQAWVYQNSGAPLNILKSANSSPSFWVKKLY